MKARPLHDRVLLKRIEEKEEVKGGIIIPDTAKEKPMEGEVISVGPKNDGRRQAVTNGCEGGRPGPVWEIRRGGNQA